MSREEEFKALIRIAPFNMKTMEKIFETLDQALHDYPEWKRHIEICDSETKLDNWMRRIKKL